MVPLLKSGCIVGNQCITHTYKWLLTFQVPDEYDVCQQCTVQGHALAPKVCHTK